MGLTIICAGIAVPGQPLAVGVTVIVAVSAVVPVLRAVKVAIGNVPLAARPMEVVLFAQA